jgi:hypothetical protein
MDQIDIDLYDLKFRLGVLEKQVEFVKESRLKSPPESKCTCKERIGFFLAEEYLPSACICRPKIDCLMRNRSKLTKTHKWECPVHGNMFFGEKINNGKT